ncbi:polysaccharide deacetylase family protein [Glutamicibacter sp. V16R2B1]|uniref:polysaccharide deacetylase family protein n=1 Tax=Glutamicibacter sp. V16R2B1 TaxID=2036207 RepID=UPI0010FED1A2|nr:polysaccharide deacetylase family protein [Glutamicibacter sp. V16R2B1]TLK54753.1 polysaccharide deacetylase [Glutamicibacter sp. V16R2B1]
MRLFNRRRYRMVAAALLLPLLAGCASPGSDQEPAPQEQAPQQVDCQQVACVALTFDDGPGEYTDRLLDELGEAQAPATFFVLGKNVGHYPQALQRMVAEGHQIGSHSYDHKDITKLTREGIEHEVQWTDEAVQQAAGVTPEVFRPPYGANGVVYNRLIPTPLLLWDVDTLDWKHHDPKKTVKIAMQEVSPGSVILMHDIHETSVDAVPELVQQLREAGYTLVTVQDLFAHTEFEPGSVYTKLKTPASAGPSPSAPADSQ